MSRRPRGPEEMHAYKRAVGARNIPEILAMTREKDPFFAGTPAHWRDGKWFQQVWERYGRRGHLRRSHYLVFSAEDSTLPDARPYKNDQDSWDQLQTASRKARQLIDPDTGTFLVDPEELEDRRNDPVRAYGDRVPQAEQAPAWARAGDEFWLPEVREGAGIFFGEPAVTGYQHDRLGDQPVLIEVWVEKSTVDDVLDPLCRALGVNLLVGTGYESITRIVELVRRAASKPVRLLYVSDYDPAGRNMPVQVSRQVEFYRELLEPGADIAIQPIVLTREQVVEYELPHAPDDMKVELDALEALHPDVLARIVRVAVAEWQEDSIETELVRAGNEAGELVAQAWTDTLAARGLDERMAALQRRMKDSRRRVAPQLREFQELLDREFAPLQQQFREISQELSDLDIDVDLPDRPVAEVPDVDVSGWLYLAEREYGEQLAHYRRHKENPEHG